jgi:hypothetical protein
MAFIVLLPRHNCLPNPSRDRPVLAFCSNSPEEWNSISTLLRNKNSMHHMNCHFKNNARNYVVQVDLAREGKGRPDNLSNQHMACPIVVRPYALFESKRSCCEMCLTCPLFKSRGSSVAIAMGYGVRFQRRTRLFSSP